MSTSPGREGDVFARVLAGVAVSLARFEHLSARARDRRRAFVRGLLCEALTAEELESLTLRLYDQAPGRFSSRSTEDWEAAMWDRWLPPVPASVLVTAAGSGREVSALLARGYSVDALEPIPDMAAACARVPGTGRVVLATHEDLVAAVETGSGPAAPLVDHRYDAVLVGWGSFTHVLSRERQNRLLSACARLTPGGPILLSFFARSQGPGERVRARVAGAALGRRLSRRRGLPPKDLEIGFVWHLGFTHTFTDAEIEALASALGRSAEVVMRPYGHAVLRPPTSLTTEA